MAIRPFVVLVFFCSEGCPNMGSFYEGLPISKTVADPVALMDRVVRGFSRYHTYALARECSGASGGSRLGGSAQSWKREDAEACLDHRACAQCLSAVKTSSSRERRRAEGAGATLVARISQQLPEQSRDYAAGSRTR